MDKNKMIEVKKLWFVANKYYDLAIDEKISLSKKDLDLTIKELINSKGVKSAFDSCAILARVKSRPDPITIFPFKF